MIKIEIKNRFTGKIIFEYSKEKNTEKETVKQLLKEYTNKLIEELDFSNMDLSDIDFSNSTFYNSTFYNSTFYNSKFDNSKFDNSTFYNSKFDNSTFDNSKFDNSTFDNSTFYNSTFYNSKFDNSTFDNSKFDNSTFYNSKFYNSKFDNSTINNLINSGALEPIRFDFFGRMLVLKNEVKFLRDSLINGSINGSSYEGKCACFIGTVANSKKCNYKEIEGIKPDSSSDTERWFMGIKEGDTPENSSIVKLTVEWIDQFLLLLK